MAKNLFNRMSGREKLAHVWHYYRGTALGVILALVAAITLIVALRNGQRSKHDLHVGIFGVSPELSQTVEQFTQQINWTGGLNLLSGSGVDGEVGQVQLVCYLSADELDVVLCDYDTARFILDEAEVPGELYQLDDTALGALAPDSGQVCLLVLSGTARAEKTQAFARALGCTQS